MNNIFKTLLSSSKGQPSQLQIFQYNTLTLQLKQNIVLRYTPKRNIFDKTQYIANYIPRPLKYNKARKPRLPQWDDPNVQWPRLIPRTNQSLGKQLLKEVEDEELMKITRQKNYIVPDFRSGDVVQFSYIHSISEKKGNTITGLILGRRNPNRLQASFKIIFRFCGVDVFMYLHQNSPMLTDLKLVERGKGNLRRQMLWLWDKNMSQDDFKKPILIGNKKPIKRPGDKVKSTLVQKSSGSAADLINDPLFEQQ